MKVQRISDCVVVRLPPQLCFYESRAIPYLDELAKIAEELHRPTTSPKTRGVLLLQKGPADDRQPQWLAELTTSCLFNDLVQRIDTWRWLLSLIRNSPVPWVYGAADSCFGSAWELALSCQRRYWFHAKALVGFPEIESGAFPPGGVLESLNKRTGRTRERWQSKPVFTASEALDDGLVDFCSDAQDWLNRASSMFNDMLRVSPNSGVRPQRRRRARDEFIAQEQQSGRAAFEQLENVWRHERYGGPTAPAAWDYCWQLVKERAKLKEAADLGRLLTLIAAQHFLSVPYAIWLQRHLVRAGGLHDLHERSVSLPPLIISLSDVAPPTEVLLRLLEGAVPLVFVAAESRDLMVGLNLLFSRLERAIGMARASDLWDQQVTWYQGACEAGRVVVLRWLLDDSFQARVFGKVANFLRLEGNASTARVGAVEWVAEPDEVLPPLVQSVLALTTEGLIKVQGQRASLPMTVAVRSLFFEEMLQVSMHAEGDLAVVVTHLKASGWRFAGDEESWDHFLRTRLDVYPFDAQLSRLTSPEKAAAGRGHWEIGSWKHAKVAAKRLSGSDTRRWNGTAISQHLAMFLGLLAEILASTERVRERNVADYLCTLALGLPERYGTPLTFLRQRGRRRVEYYAAQHWPRLRLIGTAYGLQI